MSTCYYATYEINFLIVLFEKGSEAGLELKVILSYLSFPNTGITSMPTHILFDKFKFI